MIYISILSLHPLCSSHHMICIYFTMCNNFLVHLSSLSARTASIAIIIAIPFIIIAHNNDINIPRIVIADFYTTTTTMVIIFLIMNTI